MCMCATHVCMYVCVFMYMSLSVFLVGMPFMLTVSHALC